jgi:purine-binding chemotaxis protein CheW
MPPPRQLQADPLHAQTLHMRAQALAQPHALAEQEAGEPILLFRLGTDRFSLPAAAARSVQPLDRYTPLPATPLWLLGLVNVRGRLLAAIDLRPLLMITPVPPSAGALLVIVRANDAEIGLLADAVIGVAQSSARLAPQPVNAPGLAAAWIRGVDDTLGIRCDPALLLADPRLVVNDTERPAHER